ncbi:MAG: RdgB/HAM1 family non-canonical purine NTP pyrophosphatase [Acidimicrobiales bacterium]|nr:RdgB/HAM1 family non-canonical purine NTP pyrophosphatase [Acidimicrobiales bacterium]
MQIVTATANPHKVAEIAAILGDRLELLARPASVPEIEEVGETLAENARLKARAICEATGLPALADDTGLEVDALGGAPGVRSARYAGEAADDAANVARLLAELSAPAGHRSGDGRRARFRTVMVLAYPDGREVMAEGVVDGRITEAARGQGGFGYDPVFEADDADGRTFAELGADAKNAISHRKRALTALLEALADL